MKTVLILVLACGSWAKKAENKPEWAKKDVRDYSDADLERLLEQWEEDDEPLPPDELPPGHPDKPQPAIDFSKMDMNNPDQLIRATKKGKTVMMFVKVNDFVSKEDTEQVTSIWQTGLYNNHIQGERFMLEDDRVLFMFHDGEMAFEAKDYFIEQERCEDVQLEQKTYLGQYCRECKGNEEEEKGKKKDTKKKKKDKKKKDEKKDEL